MNINAGAGDRVITAFNTTGSLTATLGHGDDIMSLEKTNGFALIISVMIWLITQSTEQAEVHTKCTCLETMNNQTNNNIVVSLIIVTIELRTTYYGIVVTLMLVAINSSLCRQQRLYPNQPYRGMVSLDQDK